MTTNIINILPAVRGSYRSNFDLSKIMWFKTGGSADVFFKPMDTQDLACFIKNKPSHIPIYAIGAGSNVIVRDGGIPGVVIKLGSGFNNIFIDKNAQTIEVGAAYLDKNLALMALENSIGGLEFLTGIPGSIGGALRMNAGCYGTEISDIIISCQIIDDKGQIHTIAKDDMGLGYRKCQLPNNWIFISAKFKAIPSNVESIKAKMDEINQQRTDTQPTGGRTGGSTFANPKINTKKAWELIDSAGCRRVIMGWCGYVQ